MGGIGSGGAREGAGRKTIDGSPRVRISITLPKWQLSQLHCEADRRGISTSGLITELLTKNL